MADSVIDPTATPETPDLPTPGDLPTHEYREWRDGKSITEIVQARPSPDATGTTEPPSETPAETAARDKAGRFTKGAAPEPGQVPAPKANPRHDPKARVDELKAEIAELAKTKGE